MDPLDVKETIEVATASFRGASRLTRPIAIFTSLFALLAAVTSLMGSRCATRGIMAKNEAILLQSMITDEWSFYYSRSSKLGFIELATDLNLGKAKSKDIQSQVAKLKEEKATTLLSAQAHEKTRDDWNKKSDNYLNVSKTFGSALGFFQSALVLTPLTLLIEESVMLLAGFSLGMVGLVFLVISYVQYFGAL